MHIWLTVLALAHRKKPTRNKWDVEGQSYVSYVIGFPLETDQIFDVNDRHFEDWPAFSVRIQKDIK